MSKKQAFGSPSCLPPTLPPLGVNREQAAELMGIGATSLDMLIEQGRAPQPRVVGSRTVYDVSELRQAFSQLPHRTDGSNVVGLDNSEKSGNPWDE